MYVLGEICPNIIWSMPKRPNETLVRSHRGRWLHCNNAERVAGETGGGEKIPFFILSNSDIIIIYGVQNVIYVYYLIREGNWMGGGSHKMPKRFSLGVYAGGPFWAFSTIPCPRTQHHHTNTSNNSSPLSLSSFLSWTPVIHKKKHEYNTPHT